MRSDLEKLDSFTLETSKNHLICNFLRNGRLRVKYILVNENLTLNMKFFGVKDIFKNFDSEKWVFE